MRNFIKFIRDLYWYSEDMQERFWREVNLHKRQEQMFERKKYSNCVFYYDQRSAGKSHYGIISCLYRCIFNRKYDSVIVCADGVQRDYISKKLRNMLLDSKFLKKYVCDFDGNIYTFKNGSCLRILKMTSIYSSMVDYIVYDDIKDSEIRNIYPRSIKSLYLKFGKWEEEDDWYFKHSEVTK